MVDPRPAQAGSTCNLALRDSGFECRRQEFGDRVEDFALGGLDFSSTVALSFKLIEKALALAGHAASLGSDPNQGCCQVEPIGHRGKVVYHIQRSAPGDVGASPGLAQEV
jgi:hypothetical protein